MSKARGLADLGNAYSDGALSNRNILINGNLTVNQRGLSIASVATGAYGEDRWKKTAGGMTQIIEEVNYLPSTVYTLSGTGVTTQQITSPASGDWTLPDIPVTARLIQLEVGDTATPFEHRSYGDELQRCQRYFQLNTAMSGSTYNSTTLSVHTSMTTEMRAAPSVALFDGTNAAVDVGAAIRNITGVLGTDMSNKLGNCLNLNIPSTNSNKYHTVRGGVISMDAEL